MKNKTYQQIEQEVSLFNHVLASIDKIMQKGELTLDDANMVFCILLKSLLLQKDVVLSEYKTLVHEETYHHIDQFLHYYFDKLSQDKKVYAERFLRHFSQSKFAGPAYAFRILNGDISCGDREKDDSAAATNLAAIVYNHASPWPSFTQMSRNYLIQMFRSGRISGTFNGKGSQEAEEILLRNEEPETIEKLCLSVAPVEELTLRPFLDVFIEYFNIPENIPDLSDVDLEIV
jgi:hypothetical protein